jgi:putative drug exporter of the RND superfamily
MVGASMLVLLLLPLVLLTAVLKAGVAMLTRGRVMVPSPIKGPLDRAIFAPYELRRVRHEHLVDATHGLWKRVGDRVTR